MKEEDGGFLSDAIDAGLADFATGKKPRPREGFDAPRDPHLWARKASAPSKKTAKDSARGDDAAMIARKRDTTTQAQTRGHHLGPWRKRKGDPYGRFDSRCVDCDKMATVCQTAPTVYNLPIVYGAAVDENCKREY
jgi:hypothetical protein